MATPAEQDQIAKFLDRVTGRPVKSQRMIALSELSRIHRRKHPDGTPYATTTNRRLITDYRAAIRATLGDDAALLHTFRYSPARVSEYKQHQAEQREERHRNQRPLNAAKHVDTASVFLEYTMMLNWSIPAAIAGVIALTGRRPYEVGCVGHFAADPDHDQQVIFSGQTKTRDEGRAETAYAIPVLARRDLVLEAVDRLRQELDPATPNKVFAQRWGRYYGEQAKQYFRDDDGKVILPRELREAYAAIAHRWFASPKISAVQYYNEVLGHQPLDLDTTLFYFAFYLTDEDQPKG